MTIVLGLTGGIGSGKSTIARYLEELGAVVIDADKVGHDALKAGSPAWNDVVAAFGKDVISTSGEIDRKKLGQIVFADSAARERLNGIMWKRIWEMISERIERERRRGTDVVAVEAFGLTEAGWDKFVDQVWVVVTSERSVVERLTRQRGLSEEEVLARIRSQTSNEERKRHADVIINNDGDPQAVKGTVAAIWARLMEGQSRSHSAGHHSS